MADKIRITCQVLNGATGEVREVVANVAAVSDQDAVNKLFAVARRDDYYYRFLTSSGVIGPQHKDAHAIEYQGQTYWEREYQHIDHSAGVLAMDRLINAIHITRNATGWQVKHTGPHAADIIRLFHTDTLPLPFTADAKPADVLATVKRLNTFATVTMEA